MDFTQDLSGFQGVLLSADNTYQFSDLSSRGGNQESIKTVINILTKFLQNGNFLNGNEIVTGKDHVLRKFAFYLILNSDLNILSEMVEMEGIDTVIWTVPTIPKCLMCDIIWGLHMDKFLFEVITLSNPHLSLEVASAFVNNIKYCTPTECLSKVKLISAALYKLACRLHCYEFDNTTLNGLLTTTFTLYQKCLKFYTEPPNSEKLQQFTEDQLYKYIGNCLQCLLLLIEECLDQFVTTLQHNFCDNCHELYSLTCNHDILAEKTPEFKICDSPVAPILECLNNSNNELLDKGMAVVMEVSVDIFCSWSEHEQNGRNVQETIGEICYRVHKQIMNVDSLSEHSVVGMLQQIARKPADYKDIVNRSDSNIIIEKVISNSVDKASWISALVHKDNLCQELTLIHLLNTNITDLNEDDCYLLYKILTRYIKENPNVDEEVKSLRIKTFRRLKEKSKFEVLEECFTNTCFEDNETVEFGIMMTEVFNKLIATPGEDLSDLLCVFLQSPQKVYNKIFHVATESSQQSQIMLKVIKYLEKFSCHFYQTDTQPCIIKIAQHYFEKQLDTEAEQNNFLNFICGLKNENVISGAKLLMLIVMPNLHKGLLGNDISCINSQVNLISLAYSLEELLAYRAPMLAMMGQVLDTVRWKLNTFVPLAPATVKNALNIQKMLFETYNTNLPEKESSWLKNKLKNLHPLNQYYYKELWSPPGDNFLEVILGKKMTEDMNLNNLSIVLSKILISSTQEEWDTIWDSLTIFSDSKTLDVIHKAVLIATAAEKVNHSENTWSCLLHLYRNLVFVIRYKYFKEPITDIQVTEVIQRIAAAINIMQEDNMEQVVTALTPLFSFVVEKNSNQSQTILEIFRSKVKHQIFLDKVNQMFCH